jgi:hypothetical protein
MQEQKKETYPAETYPWRFFDFFGGTILLCAW